MYKEELHLRLSYAPSKTLSGSKSEAQAPEVLVLCPQPAGREVLLRSGEHIWVSTHRIETQLDQSLERVRTHHITYCPPKPSTKVSDQM